MLLLGDVGPVDGLAAVGVRDRLALDADLFALHGHRLGDHLGDDVLAQAGATCLALARAHVQLLLRTRHGVVGRRTTGVVTDLLAVRLHAIGTRVAPVVRGPQGRR